MLIANKSIGEALISVELKGVKHNYLFSPSFLSLQRIGSPDQIKAAAHEAYIFMRALTSGLVLQSWPQYLLPILQAFTDKPLNPKIFGCKQVKLKNGEYSGLANKSGAINPAQIIILVNHLLRWALSGRENDEYIGAGTKSNKNLFDPLEYVSVMMCEPFCKSKNDAWSMTMTEFKMMIDAANPNKDDSKRFKKSELEALNSAADDVERKLAERSKNG